MKQKTVYEAVDGRTFDDPRGARDHEERLFNAWLKDVTKWPDFLKADPDKADQRREVLRDFWEWSYGKPI